MCMKYEDEYKTCFDVPFVYPMYREDSILPLVNFLNIQVNDWEAFRLALLKMMEQLHETGAIAPREGVGG